jgi:hypothetical protein
MTGAAPDESDRGAAPKEKVSISPEWDAHISAWKSELLAAVGPDSDVAFPTPSRDILEERLADAASEFGFRVLKVELIPAPDGAPLVIVESTHAEQFSRDTPAIFQLLDPKMDIGEDWNGWDYEGFFLGAQDEQGEPFLAVFNFWRAHGGGQWARSEELYPFPHG